MKFMHYLPLPALSIFQQTKARLNCIFPGFLAKNQVPSVAGIPLEIPSLSRDKGCSGTLLCPVRALRFYMRRTRSFRRKRKRFFISFVKNYDKEISPSTISRWIVDIKNAVPRLTRLVLIN